MNIQYYTLKIGSFETTASRLTHPCFDDYVKLKQNKTKQKNIK